MILDLRRRSFLFGAIATAIVVPQRKYFLMPVKSELSWTTMTRAEFQLLVNKINEDGLKLMEQLAAQIIPYTPTFEDLNSWAQLSQTRFSGRLGDV